MLRNRGVNATERRIRRDVLKACQYDASDVRPRWRCMNEPGYQSNFYRQPKYCTARTTRPEDFHTSSSFSSYGVQRVYLPDEDYGTASTESSLYIRNPRYSTGCYPGDMYHTRGLDRTCRRDLKYEDYYSRGPSPVYIDDDAYYSRCSRYKKLVRKVTRKLSPIFPCDYATTSNVRDMKKNNKNDLSKEAKELSRDVFKIISLLQKADGEDEEQFSSVSILQNVQNLDCHSSNSYSNLITQRVNVYPKVDKQKQGDPLTKFRSASGVRGKLEALVDALKQYETEKCNRGSSNSNYVIPSDPQSVETRSFFSGKILKSSTTLFGGKHKDIVLQTGQPKTSNKSVCGKVKIKKGDSSAVGKSLKSRLSWRRKEDSGINMRRDSANERLSDKKTERKRSLFSKTKSRNKIRSIIESEESQSEKNVPKQGQTNKAGLMIRIGGNSTRKKSASTKEKIKEKKPKPPKPPKPPKSWIKKFVEESHDTKNNMRIRWNNKAFYTKSSSTIVELVHNVYKHMGIHKNSKSDETTSKNKKTPKMITPKDSKAKMQKSLKKTKRNKQKLEAYMMPEIIVPGPFYRPNVTNQYVEKNASKSYLNEFSPKFYYGLNTTNVLSTNYFEILLPENVFLSMSEEPTGDTGYKIVEYEATSKETLMDNVNGMIVDQEDFKETGSFETIEHMHAKLVQMSDNSLCSRKRSEDRDMNVIRKGPKTKKSRIQVQELNAEETESRLFERHFSFLADRINHAKCLNWKPMSSDLFVWANCEELDDTTTKSVLEQIQISSINDDISNKTYTNIARESVIDDFTQNNVTYNVSPRESKEEYIRRKFSACNNNLVQWNKRVTGTFSESIIGVLSRKSVVMPVLWSLVKILRKNHSPDSKRGPPPPDLSLVQPPGTVSQPDCSHKSLNLYMPRRPLQFQKQKLTLEPLILAQLSSVTLQAKKELALVDSSLSSIQCDELVNDAVKIEKSDTTEESDAFMFYKPHGPIHFTNTVKAMVLDAKNIQDISSTPPSILSCTVRLVHSVTNLQTENKIKPKATRSVILLQKHKYQTKSLLLLFVKPVLHGNARIGQTLVEEERQYRNLTECYYESTEYELQDIQLESVDSNKAIEETVEKNQDIIRSENRSYVIAEKLPPDNTDPVKVLSKQKENLKECNYCRKREGRNICYNDKKKNKHLAHVTQMSKIENNKSPLHTPCILDKKPAAQFSVEVKKGDKITKILIKNHKSNKKNNKTSTNLIISQAPLITNNAEPIKQSTKRNSRKNIKVYINISNITDQEPEKSENHLNKRESNHMFTDQFCTEKADEHQVAVTEYTDLNDTIDDAVDSHRCAVYKSCSLQPCTECLQNDDTNGTNIQHDITKSTGEKKNTTEFNDFKTVFSSTDSYLYDIAAEEYVNEILGSADVIDHTKFKRVVEMKALKNTMLLNLSAFAVMAFKRELASDHTDTYMSLRQQLKRRKKVVSILSEINMRNISDCFEEQAKTGKAEYFDDLQSSVTCSLCNIFERKPISNRVKANIETNFNVRPKKDFAANDLHLVSSLTQQRLELEEFLSLLKDERKSNSDKFIDIDDTGLGALLKRSMLYSKKNPTEKIDANPISCVRNMNSMSKKKQKKLQTKKDTNRYLRSCKNNDIILTRTNSSKTLISPYTEYKVRFKNGPMKTDDTVEKTYSEVNKLDILQSCKVKKAVLQLYSNETFNEGYLVARVPKYLRL